MEDLLDEHGLHAAEQLDLMLRATYNITLPYLIEDDGRKDIDASLGRDQVASAVR